MSILIDENTRVLVQGITGKEGSFWAKHMKDYGTNIVAGVTPGKEGQNVRLAAKLTGWKIDIKSKSKAEELLQEEDIVVEEDIIIEE